MSRCFLDYWFAYREWWGYSLYVTPKRVFWWSGEVPEVQDVPSEEVSIVPDDPTATYNPLLMVVVELLDDSSFSPQEIKVKQKRSMERIMNICLIWFIIGYFREFIYTTFRGIVKEWGDITYKVSNCEEFLGENLLHGKERKELKDLLESGKFVSVLCR